MYDGAEYEDTYGMGRMDWTLDKSLEYAPFSFFILSHTKYYALRRQARSIRPVGREPTFSPARCARMRNSTHLPPPSLATHR